MNVYAQRGFRSFGPAKPGFADRIKLAAKLAGRVGFWAVTGQWEGHERNRLRRRPIAVHTSQDEYLDYGVREDLLAEARSLCQTFGVCRRILRSYANYVVGNCRIRWQTQDEAWNENAEERFWNWMSLADYSGRHTLPQLARLAVISTIRDGDIFFREFDSDGFLQLDGIEADRIGNNLGSGINIDRDGIVGGVLIGPRGRPMAYRLNDRGQLGTFVNPRDIPAEEMIHVYDSDRLDAYRGVTHFHAALDDLRDLKEIKDAEKVAQHVASRIALFVKNATASPMGSVDLLGTDTDSDGDTVRTEDIGRGAIKYAFNGDSMEAFRADRPAESWFNFQTYLIRSIAVSLDLPSEFVWDMAGLQGTATRLVSRQAQRTFGAFRSMLETRFLNRVAARWVNIEMQEGRLPFRADWWDFDWERPAHVSVDVGYDSKANLEEMAAGVRSGKEVAEERGMDVYEVLRQNARELQYAQQLADEFGVPAESITNRFQSAMEAQQAVAVPDDNSPDEEDDI